MLLTKEIGTCAKCSKGKVQYTTNTLRMGVVTRSWRHCNSCKVSTVKGDSVCTLEELKGFLKYR